jgi:hypothetical protein
VEAKAGKRQQVEKMSDFIKSVHLYRRRSIRTDGRAVTEIQATQNPKNPDRNKGKGKKFTNQALRHEDMWGSGCIDPRFLDLGTN